MESKRDEEGKGEYQVMKSSVVRVYQRILLEKSNQGV